VGGGQGTTVKICTESANTDVVRGTANASLTCFLIATPAIHLLSFIDSPAVFTMGAFVSQFLGQASPTRAPPIDPTDEVLPVHPFDGNPVLREYILFWTLQFDDVLNADMLGYTLSQLL
jgi:hypothetical protein